MVNSMNDSGFDSDSPSRQRQIAHLLTDPSLAVIGLIPCPALSLWPRTSGYNPSLFAGRAFVSKMLTISHYAINAGDFGVFLDAAPLRGGSDGDA